MICAHHAGQNPPHSASAQGRRRSARERFAPSGGVGDGGEIQQIQEEEEDARRGLTHTPARLSAGDSHKVWGPGAQTGVGPEEGGAHPRGMTIGSEMMSKAHAETSACC